MVVGKIISRNQYLKTIIIKCNKLLLAVLGAGLLLVSCEKDETPGVEIEKTAQEVVPKQVLKQLADLHFNTEDVKIGKVMRPDGSFEESYIVEGDLAFTANQLNRMSPSTITQKQYRTYNLVSTPRVIDVVGFMGGAQALTQKERTALEMAIANYNELDLDLEFTLRFGTDFQTADIVVFQAPGAAGGVSGFPSDRDPYMFVQIFSGLEDFSVETNTHVIAHEIGHTLGLRHTDWYSRQSCGRPSFGELSGVDGAVHIPGTPRRYDPTSLMLSCFSGNEDGQFGQYDKVALEYLY